jgi:hypothetical protein
MTTNPSNVLVATPPSEATSTINDPFIDRSTPRHNRRSLAALVAAIQQVSHILSTTSFRTFEACKFLKHSTVQSTHRTSPPTVS